MFVVGDSDSQKTFRTYLNYVQNVATFIDDEYGSDPADRYANVYAATLPLLKSIHRSSPTIKERQYLKGSIHNLVCLQKDAKSEDFFEAKNAWTPVQGWYTLHNLLCAIGCYVSPGTAPDHDRSCRNAAQIIADRNLLPYPWSAYVDATFTAKSPSFTHHRFRRAPKPISNLAAPTLANFEDNLAIALETTLTRRAGRKLDSLRKQDVKKGRIRRNLSKLEINRTYKKAGPATLLDVLYRLRIRANYGNVDAFVEGCGSLNDAREFAQAIYVVVDATAATLEALLQAYAGSALLASVITELSRRHSTEEVVAARASIHLPTPVLGKTAYAPARPS